MTAVESQVRSEALEAELEETEGKNAAPELDGPQHAPSPETGSLRVRMEAWRKVSTLVPVRVSPKALDRLAFSWKRFKRRAHGTRSGCMWLGSAWVGRWGVVKRLGRCGCECRRPLEGCSGWSSSERCPRAAA